jgi:hypothetical protein
MLLSAALLKRQLGGMGVSEAAVSMAVHKCIELLGAIVYSLYGHKLCRLWLLGRAQPLTLHCLLLCALLVVLQLVTCECCPCWLWRQSAGKVAQLLGSTCFQHAMR